VSDLGASVAWGLVVAGSLLAGALTAATVRIPGRLAATVTAFGGGTLIAAIGLQLVPTASRQAGLGLTAVGMLAGTLTYVGVDAWLTRDADMRAMRRSCQAVSAGGRMAAMAAGRGDARRGEAVALGGFVDGVPESLALGLMVASGGVGFALLAGILVGNVVESYGAARLIVGGGQSGRFALTLLGALGLALAFATVLGGTVLSGADPALIGTAQAVAAGAVLAVVSIAIIPNTFSEVSHRVASATVLGFIGGYLLS
jgi:zinc transporter, ZIP family